MRQAASEVALLRVISQQLATPASSLTNAVTHLTCLQAQDWKASRSALALRSDTAVADVDEAANSAAIVRSWPMRGTLHWLPAQDLQWMLSLTSAATVRAAAGRHRQLGIADRDVEEVRSLTQAALADGGCSRSDLKAAWVSAGVDVAGQRFIHLLQRLALDGVVCLGPVVDSQQHLVLCATWIPSSRTLERDAAIVEFAQRYLRSHGPASMADFCWWSKLLVRDVKPLWAQIVSAFEEIQLDGRALYVDPRTLDALPNLRAAARAPMLLPAFDELIIGYADRAPTLSPSDFEKVVPGRNGYFLPTVLHQGRAVATWKAEDPVVTAPFGNGLPTAVDRALPRLARTFPR
ncbi:winged helix DNA-binding protein [Branchiibius hedensis]|uniref:Winged helix DNA-binding domain-containing protein n=1 Tax=Branchiibius hedensis TaxID=672460 RepID=A0A2Y8ZRX1_9MICO|nr:winged helix DNA-binding domain-containing protein [Branchiibius hedensis]PWJ25822.1 winged helix DNA-binding protein [Branchiibius hedensis]SSA34635.1 Winged helix DNA-binding domain-containing protein [Branchiibius hedensis]